MNTTVYIPMPEWQALSFLRNRDDAFARLLTPFGTTIGGEVVLQEGVLVGYRQRDRAVEAGYLTHPQGFAILRIVLGKLQHGTMALYGQLDGSARHPETGAYLWLITADGLRNIQEKVARQEVDILMDEIFGPCTPEQCPANG